MMTDGHLVDGSWELSVIVTDLEVENVLRVKGDLHIGGVMLRLVEALDIAIDWSDHGLWWPEKNMWLSRTRSTLDQYGVQADAKLWFTPMHKNLRLQLPDLQIMDLRVNFSTNVFSAVIRICKELGIRHPEELSLARKLDREQLKKNRGIQMDTVVRRHNRPTGMTSPSNHNMSSGSLDGTLGGSPHRMPNTPQGTLIRGNSQPYTPGSPYNTLGGGSPGSPYTPFNANGTLSPGSMHSLSFEGAMDSTLANSPITPTREALMMLYRPKNFAEKARINAGWLDSSRSLMEQGIRENDLMLLRFKFYSFYDLNPKYDLIRINQIYEQARWQMISEEIDCTEEEMMVFAALQLQAQLQSNMPQPDLDGTNNHDAEDEIDAALNDLQVSLEGSSMSTMGDITKIPELQDYLRFFKPRKFTLKSYKKYFFVFKDTHLSMYRSREEMGDAPAMKINLRGCEVNPDVNISSGKYNIKLYVPSADGMSEMWIRAETEDQYARWMSACKLASKGKTMADSSYDNEVQSIKSFLNMQHPAPAQTLSPSQIDLQPEDFVSPRFLRKLKTKSLSQRILEAHANVRDMNLLEAKMNYIKAWQALPEYGISYFIVKFKGSKKDELIGVAFNRLIRMDLHNGDSLKTWRFQNMKTWSVNWEIKQVQVCFEGEDIRFNSLTADCKVVHEFIGGYIYLSMRSGDKNQTLNEELFHKLTGGWV